MEYIARPFRRSYCVYRISHYSFKYILLLAQSCCLRLYLLFKNPQMNLRAKFRTRSNSVRLRSGHGYGLTANDYPPFNKASVNHQSLIVFVKKNAFFCIYGRLPRLRSCLLAPVSHDTSRGSGRQEDTGSRKDMINGFLFLRRNSGQVCQSK
jgi:hypothetical protein